MKSRTLMIITLSLMVVFTGSYSAFAEAGTIKAEAATLKLMDKGKELVNKSEYQEASFKLPKLDKDLAKKLSIILAEDKNVLTTKPDLKENLLLVTYKTGKTNPESLMKMMTPVSKEVKLVKVLDVKKPVSKKGCAGCPSRKSCTKKSEKTKEHTGCTGHTK